MSTNPDNLLLALQAGQIDAGQAVIEFNRRIDAAELTEAQAITSIGQALNAGLLDRELGRRLLDALTQATVIRAAAPEEIANGAAEAPIPDNAATTVRLLATGATSTAVRLLEHGDLEIESTRLRAPGTKNEELEAGLDPTAFAVAQEFVGDPPTVIASSTQMSVPDSLPVSSLGFGPGALVRGRFELVSKIGQGGMGVVYSAIDRVKADAGDPQHRVAIKLLAADLQDLRDAFLAFQREASKAQTLAHPNIATVFDFDRDGNTGFIVMELLEGQSLDAVIRQSAGAGVSRKMALPIIRGIAEGLAYAHKKGIVHSDLKPANIFLTADGIPKILDFGIARSIPSASATGPRDTFDAGTLGAYTPAYATEEMVAGNDASTADDLYAVGIIIYELLSAKHPYNKKNAADARRLGLVPNQIPNLRRREWKTLEQSLAFDRRRRPQDASEFIRRFFGSTALRSALLVATVVFALASGILGYEYYRAAGPSIPFDQLPPATQQKLTQLFTDGDREWGFYVRDGTEYALWSSIDLFSEAYSLHPRDRKAVSGLERAADAVMAQALKVPDRRREAAQALAEKSEYLAKYPPVARVLAH